MKSIVLFTVGIILFWLNMTAYAKEVLLTLNAKTDLPMKVYYRFSSGNHCYGKGHIDKLKNNQTYHVAVNRVPDNKTVLVQVYKMTVAHETEINDPCEVELSRSYLNANITVGFKGNRQGTHGSFNCRVWKS